MTVILEQLKKRVDAGSLFFPLFEKEKPEQASAWQILDRDARLAVKRSLGHHFTGKLGESHDIFLRSKRPEAVVLIGLGQKKDWTTRRFILISRKLVALANKNKQQEIAVPFDPMVPASAEQARAVQSFVEALLMAQYDFRSYKELPKHGWPDVRRVRILSDHLHKDRKAQSAVKMGAVIASAVNHCRDLANTPGGDMTPRLLAEDALKTGKAAGFRIKVLGPAEMKRLKMGAILGVARGSVEQARFIIMEYRHGGSQSPIIFVGKGVTFDTGGLNIKPENSMLDMHMDMSGGAAVIGALEAIAKLRLRVNVIGLVPAVENMPSGSGYRPGDLLRSMSGKTIEVKNTDAEGRVILADALTYANRYKPSHVVDLATLTGAAMVALGQHAAALLTSDERFASLCQETGETSGDYLWRLPLWEEYEDEVKGTFGDVSNTGKTRYGGAITGAMFLKQFVGKYVWAHLDIAPTMTSVDGQNLAKGATGTGVRFLVELASRLSLK